MTERVTYHLDEIADSINSSYAMEQPFDRWVGNCAVANGCFDVLHPGHLAILATLDTEAYARRLRPLVAMNSDVSVRRLKGSNRPIVPESARAKLINHLKWPLTVVIFDEDTPQRLMDLLKPRVVIKGGEYDPRTVVRWHGSEWCLGSDVIRVPMVDEWSTSRMIMGDTR